MPAPVRCVARLAQSRHTMNATFLCTSSFLFQSSSCVCAESIYGAKFADEFANGVVEHEAAGLLSMANTGPNTNGYAAFAATRKPYWHKTVTGTHAKPYHQQPTQVAVFRNSGRGPLARRQARGLRAGHRGPRRRARCGGGRHGLGRHQGRRHHRRLRGDQVQGHVRQGAGSAGVGV